MRSGTNRCGTFPENTGNFKGKQHGKSAENPTKFTQKKLEDRPENYGANRTYLVADHREDLEENVISLIMAISDIIARLSSLF